MRIYEYKKKTLDNLACALITDKSLFSNENFRNYIDMLICMAADILIPWPERKSELSINDFLILIKDYVKESFKHYHGPITGQAAHKQNKRLILSLLFGARAAESMMPVETEEDVVVFYNFGAAYEKGNWSIQVPGYKRTKSGTLYDGKALKWCKRMAPAILNTENENSLVDIMMPAYLEYGWNRIHQENRMLRYDEGEYAKCTFDGIRGLVMESIDIPYERLTPEKMVCHLEWCLEHTPENLQDIVKNHDWGNLCEAMEDEWDEYLERKIMRG